MWLGALSVISLLSIATNIILLMNFEDLRKQRNELVEENVALRELIDQQPGSSG